MSLIYQSHYNVILKEKKIACCNLGPHGCYYDTQIFAIRIIKWVDNMNYGYA